MKSKVILLALSLITSLALAHSGVEIGPNGGRILEFSKDETMHGELTVAKDGSFQIALLDKDMKPVAVVAQSLKATGGTREAPTKLEVTKTDKAFKLPAVKPGEWLILQYKNGADGKTITARMEYNTETCDACKSVEWLCKCPPAK